MTDAEKVQAIIALEGNDFVEADSPFLLKLNEQAMDDMLKPKTNESDCPCKKEAPKVNADEAKAKIEAPVTLAQVGTIVANALKETVPALIASAVADINGKSEAAPILKRLKANSNCKFEDSQLEAMDAPALTALEKSIAPDLYDGKGTIRDNSSQSDADVIPASPSIHGVPAKKEA